MIWFNIRKLEDKISKNELSDKDGFNYVLAYFILSVFAMSLGTHDKSVWIKLLHFVLLATITIWGLTAAYKANDEIDGKDFFKRFFAINWVIGMRMLFALVILIFIVGIVMAIISRVSGGNYVDNSPIKDFITLISVSLFEVIYYLLVINSIRRLKPVSE
jgi:hypothetical protein